MENRFGGLFSAARVLTRSGIGGKGFDRNWNGGDVWNERECVEGNILLNYRTYSF